MFVSSSFWSMCTQETPLHVQRRPPIYCPDSLQGLDFTAQSIQEVFSGVA